MKKVNFIVLASILCFSSIGLASGSSGSSGIPSGGPSGGSSIDPYKVTVAMKCVVTEIKADGTVVVRDAKQSTTHVLTVNDQTKFSARDKKAFAGRKELRVSDLKVGHELKVVKRQVNGEVLRVKVLKAT